MNKTEIKHPMPRVDFARCRHCTYYRSGEQVVTDCYSGITDSYDGYCCFGSGFTNGVLVLVNANSCCNRFCKRGD